MSNWIVQACFCAEKSYGAYTSYSLSTVNLSLPLIQEGQLSVSGERMHNIG